MIFQKQKPTPLEAKKDWLKFLYDEIIRYTALAGGDRALSQAIGHDKSYVRVIMWRDRTSRIEKLYEEIKAHYDPR